MKYITGPKTVHVIIPTMYCDTHVFWPTVSHYNLSNIKPFSSDWLFFWIFSVGSKASPAGETQVEVIFIKQTEDLMTRPSQFSATVLSF